MKSTLSLIVALSVVAFAGVGCQSPAKSRVVRLMPNTAQNKWRVSVNGVEDQNPITLDSLTNRLAHLHLQHGDVVLFGKLLQFNSGDAKTDGDWLTRYFSSNKVAIFIYPDTGGSISSVPIYHWVAPFENPRNLEKASFFLEGRFLGAGEDGYRNMVRKIRRGRSPRIFVLGSLYDINTGFGPLESPYEDHKKLLDGALKMNGTQVLIPSELPGL